MVGVGRQILDFAVFSQILEELIVVQGHILEGKNTQILEEILVVQRQILEEKQTTDSVGNSCTATDAGRANSRKVSRGMSILDILKASRVLATWLKIPRWGFSASISICLH